MHEAHAYFVHTTPIKGNWDMRTDVEASCDVG